MFDARRQEPAIPQTGEAGGILISQPPGLLERHPDTSVRAVAVTPPADWRPTGGPQIDELADTIAALARVLTEDGTAILVTPDSVSDTVAGLCAAAGLRATQPAVPRRNRSWCGHQTRSQPRDVMQVWQREHTRNRIIGGQPGGLWRLLVACTEPGDLVVHAWCANFATASPLVRRDRRWVGYQPGFS